MYFGVLIGIGNHMTMKFTFLRGAFIHQKDEPWSNWPASGKMSSSNVHRCASNDSIPFADHWNSFGNAHTFPVCDRFFEKSGRLDGGPREQPEKIKHNGGWNAHRSTPENWERTKLKKIRNWIIIASCSCCCCCCSCYCCCCCIKSSEPLLCLFFV